MKTSARFLAMLLAVVMIAGAALSATAFDDVAGNKHANAVNVLAQLGVIGGYEDGTFKPDQKVTRAEMAKLAYVLYTTFVDAGTAKTAFADVADDHWATGYINWCSQQGIIGGYGDGKFGPNDNVTYDQALKMVCGVLGYTDFQSNLWPTDVRMTALRTLELGTELEDVKGADQLTRAQVAQIMYNALNADMNETKTVQVPLGDTGYTVPVEVAKTLAIDIWKFAEVTFTVSGTENYGEKVDEDEIAIKGEFLDKDGKNVTYTNEVWKLADYGLEKYEGKTDALIGLELTALKNNKDEFVSATITGSVLDGVEVKYNAKAKTVLNVNGTDYKYDKEDSLVVLNLADLTTAPVFVEDTEAKKETYVVDPTLAAKLEVPYMARAIDVDGDGVIDQLVIAGVDFYIVDEVKTNKTKDVILNTLADAYAKTVPSEDLTVAVEADDVIAIANLGGINYTEIIEGVETFATKLTATDNKITLDGVGVVEYADGVIDTSDVTKLLGADNKATFYIYNGEIILQQGLDTSSEYKIAILKDIVMKDKGTLNTNTMKYETSYEAIIIVDGKEIVAPLSASAEVVLTKGTEEYTADEAAKAFGTVYGDDKKPGEEDGSVKYPYLLLTSYEVDEKGYYTLKADIAYGEGSKAVTGTIAYDAEKGVYAVGGETRVVLDDNSVIFYTYTDEDKTGDFKYIGSYDKTTITDKTFVARDLVGNAYVTYNEATKTYTLVAAMVNGEIKGVTEAPVDYTNDGTLILYAPAGSSVTSQNGKLYYEYTFMEDLENKAPVIDTTKETKDATETVAGGFYGWDNTDEVYKSAEGKDSFVRVTLDEIFYTSTAVLAYGDNETASISDDVTIWGLGVDEDGKKVYDVYQTLSVSELSTMLDETAKEDIVVDAILVRTLNRDKSTEAKPVWVVKSIIVNIYEIDEDTEKYVAINDLLFNKNEA